MLEQLGNRQPYVVRVLVERLAPYKGRVYDPCCGSAGMFVQSEKFVEEHGGHRRLATTSRCYTGTFAKPSHLIRIVFITFVPLASLQKVYGADPLGKRGTGM